jgi:hypothetical protein
MWSQGKYRHYARESRLQMKQCETIQDIPQARKYQEKL